MVKVTRTVKTVLHVKTGKGLLKSLFAGLVMVLLPILTLLHTRNDIVEFTDKQLQQGHLVYNKNINADSNHDPSIQAEDQYQLQWILRGYVFDGDATTTITSPVTTAMIHDFSPHVREEVSKRFIDPTNSVVEYLMSPALKWRNGELILVARIFLGVDECDKTTFVCNWLYTEKYDKHMNPISNPSLLGIPMPAKTYKFHGPQDARLFSVRDKLFIVFDGRIFHEGMYMVMWDYDLKLPILPLAKGINTSQPDLKEKNWSPLVQDDQLYFVQNLDPLRVLHCELDGACKFIYDQVSGTDFSFNRDRIHLRGGTPFELYQWPYFISVAHSIVGIRRRRFYASHLVVLCAKSYRMVYVSRDIQISDDIYRKYPPLLGWRSFIFAVSLIIENKDSLVVGVHVNDNGSILLRLNGVADLMENVISKDSQRLARSGPPAYSIQKHLERVRAWKNESILEVHMPRK